MLRAVLGLFSQDLAVDLGTSSTRLYRRGTGVVADAPTVVALERQADGARMVAAGEQALPMLGRTPRGIEAVQPVRDGRIAKPEVAEALLLHLVQQSHGRSRWVHPRLVVGIPHPAADDEVRLLRRCCEAAGAREIRLVARPLAAAVGAGLPAHEPTGTLIVDLGGGRTEISLIASGRIIASSTVAGGGEGMDHAVIHWLSERQGVLVGRWSAERLKHEVGHVHPTVCERRRATVRGRCLRRGIPTAVPVDAEDLRPVFKPAVQAIADEIRRLLRGAPPELSTDVVDRGVVLTGAGSQLAGLDLALRDLTQLPFVRAEAPGLAVVRGLGSFLEQDPALAGRMTAA